MAESTSDKHQRAGTGRHSRSALWAGLAGGAVAILAMILYLVAGPGRGPAPAPSQEAFGTAPAYTLTDQNGASFSSSALHGKIQVVSYLFPYCTSYCPIAAQMLAQTEQLASTTDLRNKITFVAFNVDPEGAGPAQLHSFMTQEGIDPADPAWHYLTGNPAQIRQVVTGGYHVFYQKVSLAEEEKTEAEQKAGGTYTPQPTEPNALADQTKVTYDIVHNDVIEIVDGQGIIRAIFNNASGTTPEQILAAVRNASR